MREALHRSDGQAALARGEVHVWHADLDQVPDSLVSALLSTGERQRSAAIVVPTRRTRWARSRALLRSLLGSYLECDPRTLELTPAEHGKPALACARTGAGERTPLRFSVSHSGTAVLYALAHGREVGVDVELRAPERRLLALAQRSLDARSSDTLAALEPAARGAAFLAAWTRREAQLKCLGVGLAGGRERPDAGTWTIPLALAGDGAAALCVQGCAGPVRARRWAPGTLEASSPGAAAFVAAG